MASVLPFCILLLFCATVVAEQEQTSKADVNTTNVALNSTQLDPAVVDLQAKLETLRKELKSDKNHLKHLVALRKGGDKVTLPQEQEMVQLENQFREVSLETDISNTKDRIRKFLAAIKKLKKKIKKLKRKGKKKGKKTKKKKSSKKKRRSKKKKKNKRKKGIAIVGNASNSTSVNGTVTNSTRKAKSKKKKKKSKSSRRKGKRGKKKKKKVVSPVKQLMLGLDPRALFQK